MPLPLPNLDDRRFTDVAVEMRSLIHQLDKAWTNHNPTDPGMTLIELLAWLAEMLMYRINRIEQRNYLTFLELIGLEPAGPQAVLTFEIKIPKAALTTAFVLQRGTRVAARDELSGGEIIFETVTDVPYNEDNWDDDRLLWVFEVSAKNTVRVKGELLGFSKGVAHQEFSLKQGPLFLARDQETYPGNPQVALEESGIFLPWTYKTDLLSSAPGDEHFTVEALSGLIRFGDGVKGKIPPAGSKVSCTYRRVGSGAGNAAARTITILLDPLPGISPSAVSVFNEYAASGGTDGETLDDLLARGLAFLQEPFRAVSEQDFAFLIQQAVPGKVSRIKVVADQNLEALPPEAEAHISVIVLPSRGELALTEQPATYNAATEIFTLNRTAAVLTASLAGTQVKRLYREIFRYLDQRRLITTIVHVVRPVFTIVRLRIDLQAKPGVNLEVLKKNVGEAMATFLDPYAGWQEGDGWPYGRDVYRSELYQLLESLEGVDHVTALSMNNDPVTALISVGENHLVALDGLSVTVSS